MRRILVAIVLLSAAAILLYVAHEVASVHGPIGPSSTVTGHPR